MLEGVIDKYFYCLLHLGLKISVLSPDTHEDRSYVGFICVIAFEKTCYVENSKKNREGPSKLKYTCRAKAKSF